MAERWPDEGAEVAARLRSRFYDHIPEPAIDLFRWIETPRDGKVKLWREIPAGEGRIGSPESVGHDVERPRHRVTITRSFWLAVVPVTNAQYAAFDPRKADEGRSTHPVVGVTWYEAVSFCRWLSTLPGLKGIRLPTEEEWEYACRAGSETAYWLGDHETSLAEVGWYQKNSGGRTHGVGEKRANPWGLYDMHGNGWEWTASVWKKHQYAGGEASVNVDPSEEPADLAAPSGDGRVLRGGSYLDDADGTRSAYRVHGAAGLVIGNHGFRVLSPLPPA